MSDQNDEGVEPLITIQEAAKTLGLHAWKLRRAAKEGLVPSYAFFNTRRLVRLSEVIACVNATRTGEKRQGNEECSQETNARTIAATSPITAANVRTQI